MHRYKRILACACALAAACGCGARPPAPAAAGGGKGGAATAPLVIPEKIPDAARGAWEARLFLMPDDAEQRPLLRDRLAESVAASFEAVPEAKAQKRLELFREGLSLHASADFERGDLATALAPAARWIVARYERRGDEVVVLAGLKYLALVEPGDPRHEEAFAGLAEWSERARGTIPDPLEARASIADMYLRVVRLVPERGLCERAAERLVAWNAEYASRLEAEGADEWGLSPFAFREAEKIPIYLTYVFFLSGDATRAGPWIDRLRGGGRSLDAFRELLGNLGKGGEIGDAYFTLAQLFGSEDAETRLFSVGDPLAGLRACVLARRLGERSPRYPLCVGQFFELMGRPESAAPFYVETARVSPDESTYTGVAARLRFALNRVHALERLREAEEVIALADGLVADILALEGVEDETLYRVTAELLRLAGEVEYADGRIEKSIAHFAKAGEVFPGDVGAVFRLAEIRAMRGESDAALALAEEALERAEGAGGAEESYWPARAYELRGEIREGRGDAAGAAADYRKALGIWEKGELPLDFAAESALRRGMALDRLGDLAASREWLRRAVGLDPENRSTYGTAFSFLFLRGRLDTAEELFEIAFNQDRIGPMWKIYFALWVEGLARREGRSVELARNYLAHADADTWQDDLARFASGRIDAEELGRRAANPGQRVEADFYVGLRLLGEGRAADARPRLEKVIASGLMGFFEYPMARALLDATR